MYFLVVPHFHGLLLVQVAGVVVVAAAVSVAVAFFNTEIEGRITEKFLDPGLAMQSIVTILPHVLWREENAVDDGCSPAQKRLPTGDVPIMDCLDMSAFGTPPAQDKIVPPG